MHDGHSLKNNRAACPSRIGLPWGPRGACCGGNFGGGLFSCAGQTLAGRAAIVWAGPGSPRSPATTSRPSRPRPGLFQDASLQQLIVAARLPGSGISEIAVNASPAFIEGAKPQGEVECALVIQMACT
jgi:hypothetical protein